MRFLMGLAIGIGFGMLFAPAAGEETRRQLMNKANELTKVPQQKVVELAEAGQQKAGEIGAKVGRKAAEAAVEALRNGLTPEKEQKAV
jgi:gas vesicle protein